MRESGNQLRYCTATKEGAVRGGAAAAMRPVKWCLPASLLGRLAVLNHVVWIVCVNSVVVSFNFHSCPASVLFSG